MRTNLTTAWRRVWRGVAGERVPRFTRALRRRMDAHGQTGCQARARRPPAEGLKWCGYPWAVTRAIRPMRPPYGAS
jgi:hypothetical protein